MATRKRKPARRHNTRRKVNRKTNRRHNPRRPNVRRRTNRRHNPRRHHAKAPARRRHNRRRNPSLGSLTGILGETITALIGAGIVTYAYGLVGPMIPLGGIFGQVGVKLGLAWGLGELAKRTGFASHSKLLTLGGAISAGQDVLNTFVGGGGLLFPAPQVQAKPGRVALPAEMTGEDVGVSEIVYAPTGYGTLGDIVNAPDYPWLYA